MEITISKKSDELVQDCPDYWYVCPACGHAYNVQLPVDDPPKTASHCHYCGTPLILLENEDESD